MTPSTRLAALVLAASLLPCLPAEAGATPRDLELRLQSTFERSIGALVALTVENRLKRTVEAQMGALRARELLHFAGLSRSEAPPPAAPHAAQAAEKTSASGASESTSSPSSEESEGDTVCTFSPPGTLLCVLRAEASSVDPGEP